MGEAGNAGGSAAATAEEITRASKSNLALAFVALSPERRRDMNVFYAFCRLVDDLADEPEPSLEERRAGLQRWRDALISPAEGESPLAPEVRTLIGRYRLQPEQFAEIIAGCEMDLDGARYETWEDLRMYCHRVASVVGLISIEIFGYTDERAKQYAESLGLALQLTNILRDIGEDYSRGARIYLPRQEMARFGVSEADLAAGRRTSGFLELMAFQAARARGFYAEATAALPAHDQRTLAAAEIMRAIYSRVLSRMEADGFRVFDRRYRVSKPVKLAIIGRTLLRCLWRR